MGSEPPEIVVIGNDGEPNEPRRPRPPHPGSRRAAIFAVVVLLVFGLGFAVGTHVGDSGKPAQTAGTSSAPSAPPTPVGPSGGTRAETSSSAKATTPTAGAGGTAVDEKPGLAPRVGNGTLPQTPTALDMCGNPVTVARVAAVGPMPRGAAAGVRLAAGFDARVIDVGSAALSVPLVPTSSGAAAQYVRDMGAQANGAAMVVGSCGNPHAVSFSEIVSGAAGFEAKPLPVAMPEGSDLRNLVVGGSSPYLAIFTPQGDPAAQPIALLAPGADSVPVALPAGFTPVAGYRDLVIGAFQPTAAASGQGEQASLVQIFSPHQGGIVGQLGTLAAHYLPTAGSIIWQPTCAGSCEVHRYDIATGADRAIGRAPETGATTVQLWLALSPDGTRLAMIAPQDADAPADSVTHGDDHPPPGTLTIAVVNLTTGETTYAAGLSMPWPMAYAAFSPDSKWLFVGVPTVGGSRVLAYDQDMRGPYDVATFPGVGGGTVPLAVLPSAPAGGK